jgi:hypothetical protein
MNNGTLGNESAYFFSTAAWNFFYCKKDIAHTTKEAETLAETGMNDICHRVCRKGA